MFGLQDNDASRFPSPCGTSSRSRDRLTCRSQVTVDELTASKEVIRSSTLLARYHTMKDERGGLQRFLFERIGIPRTPVMASNGEPQEIYLENIAPLFYIDQNEGWTDLQALQVYRYGLLEIAITIRVCRPSH